jgi:hypothetical protein
MIGSLDIGIYLELGIWLLEFFLYAVVKLAWQITPDGFQVQGALCGGRWASSLS